MLEELKLIKVLNISVLLLLGLIVRELDLIVSKLDLTVSRLDLIVSRLNLTSKVLGLGFSNNKEFFLANKLFFFKVALLAKTFLELEFNILLAKLSFTSLALVF